MVRVVDLALRVVLIIFAVIALGTAGGLYGGFNSSYSRTNFNLFATSWAIVISGFLSIAFGFFASTFGSWVIAIGDFLTTVFLFAGACSYAAWGGVPNCSADYAILKWGGSGPCRQYQVCTAFLFLGFGVALGLTIWSVILVFQGGSIGLPRRGGRSAPRAGVPTMSKV